MKIEEVFAYLCVSDAPAALDFYQRAFGAKEKFRLTEPSGRIGHAELLFGPMIVMVSDEYPEYGIRSASSIGATAVTIHLHVDDADAMIAQAIKAGATLEREADRRVLRRALGRGARSVRAPLADRTLDRRRDTGGDAAQVHGDVQRRKGFVATRPPPQPSPASQGRE